MKLVNFSVTNFRSITKAHKIAISETTVLIGKNNEGKSNILKALAVAMNILERHASARNTRISPLSRRYRDDEKFYFWERDFPINLQGRESSTKSIFRLEFSLNKEEIGLFKEVIKSNLNGTLPLELKIGKDNQPSIKVSKRGRGAKTLNSKSGKIARFVAERISFNYIPAVRTDKEALLVIQNMLSQELRDLEKDEKYQEALNVITELQQPVLKRLANKIREPLSEFLPNIADVHIEIPEGERRVALRREFTVVIDDGTPTNIEFKGDGVKSLAALALLKDRHIASGASVIAIEEPESHLHPAAIHQLNKIIASLTTSNQIILTTHNPLFVDRHNLSSNIIIDSGKATSAKDVKSIRQLLGVKASDNLTNANYALVVEGEEDAKALFALLPTLSDRIGKSLKNHMLVIEPIGGAGNLPYKLSLMHTSLCVYHVLLDNDDAGRKAFEKASEDGLLTPKNCTFVNCRGMHNSEFEDCLESSVYKNEVLNEFGVDINASSFKCNKKWSDRMKGVFMDQGKCWNGKIEGNLKSVVSEAVVDDPCHSLNSHKRNSIDALVGAIEGMLGLEA